jgi:tRNA(fMet)-specific endonuclease VapC
MGRYPVLPVDESVAAQFGKLASELRRVDQPKPVLDLLIAATARQSGLTIATRNAKHFSDIPGLNVEEWNIY